MCKSESPAYVAHLYLLTWTVPCPTSAYNGLWLSLPDFGPPSVCQDRDDDEQFKPHVYIVLFSGASLLPCLGGTQIAIF